MMNPTTGQYDELILRIATVLVRVVIIALWIALAAIALAIPGVILWRGEVLAELASEGIADGVAIPALLALMTGGGAILYAAVHFFGRLRALMRTIGSGDPFVPENAERLRLMAWLLLAIEAGGLALGLFSHAMFGRSNGFEFSVTGLIAVLSLFVLARVFARGTAMREDIEGTV